MVAEATAILGKYSKTDSGQVAACVGILEVPEENWGMYGQQVHLAAMQIKPQIRERPRRTCACTSCSKTIRPRTATCLSSSGRSCLACRSRLAAKFPAGAWFCLWIFAPWRHRAFYAIV